MYILYLYILGVVVVVLGGGDIRYTPKYNNSMEEERSFPHD